MKISNTISAVLQLIIQMPAKPAHNFMTNLDLSFTSVISTLRQVNFVELYEPTDLFIDIYG